MHAWDEGVAFYTGSLAADDPIAAGGKLIWALAEKRCKNYQTCGPNGDSTSLSGTTAKVNNDHLFEFNKGRDALQAGKCAEVRPIVRKVVSLMTIPLIQGTIRYARYMGPVKNMGADKQSEAAVFAASVLPMVHACSATDAAVIEKHASLASTTWSAMKRPDYASWDEVKTAFENNYACLGVTCADIGGLWGRVYLGTQSADGRRLSESTYGYLEGAEPFLKSALEMKTSSISSWLLVAILYELMGRGTRRDASRTRGASHSRSRTPLTPLLLPLQAAMRGSRRSTPPPSRRPVATARPPSAAATSPSLRSCSR